VSLDRADAIIDGVALDPRVKRSFVAMLLRTGILLGFLVSKNWTPLPRFFISVDSKGG